MSAQTWHVSITAHADIEADSAIEAIQTVAAWLSTLPTDINVSTIGAHEPYLPLVPPFAEPAP